MSHVVSKETSYRLDGQGFFLVKGGIFLFAVMSRPVLSVCSICCIINTGDFYAKLELLNSESMH
jgi:hypothetical protein